MVNLDNYFDLHDVVFNELIGDVWLTVLVGLIIIFMLSIKTKMPYQMTLLFGVLWLSIIFATYTSLLIIWVFVVLLAGTMFYYSISRAFKRG